MTVPPAAFLFQIFWLDVSAVEQQQQHSAQCEHGM
jgi:hypothetical protein